ncbi:MAG: hypothetical protein L3J51_07740 [Cocleimonas sp.]|nr:hypothetical protein [Cocleimonas sp.]
MSDSKYKLYLKIYFIRWQEKLNRREFCERIGMPVRALEVIESKGTTPRGQYLKAICKEFPEYTLWLMLDEVNVDSGQISPMIKYYWTNRLTIIRGLDSDMDIKEFFEKHAKFDRKNPEHIKEVIEVIDHWYGGETDLEYPFHSSVFHGTKINFDL